MNALRTALASLAASLLASSCLVYPDRGLCSGGQRRGFTPEAVQRSLEPGRTRREEVLCALGQPEYVSPDGTRLLYWVREARSAFFVYLVVDMGLSVSGKDHYLLLSFEPSGLLREKRELEHGFSSSGGFANPLTADECERMFATGKAVPHRW